MNEFWNGFAYGCLAVIVVEIAAVVAYAFKRGGRR